VDNEKHNTDILCISWTYADHNTGKKMPYTVNSTIAGIDKTVLSEVGKLSDWVDFKYNTTTKGFEIEVKNERNFFTLSSEMSFGEYINVINGKAHTYTGTGSDVSSFNGVMGLSQ